MNEGIHIEDRLLMAWFEAIPDDPYAPCPCFCGSKFRFVSKDEKTLGEHEARFVENYKKEHSL